MHKFTSCQEFSTHGKLPLGTFQQKLYIVKLYNCKYFGIFGEYNYCIIMNISDNLTDEEYFKTK